MNGEVTEVDQAALSAPHEPYPRYLPTLLRWAGGAALVFAMYSFLLQGWEGGSDLFRYGLMLAHTALLAAVALASGHWLKEGKGPRLLVSLSLVSVSANFAILGAFMFAGLHAVGPHIYPAYLTWQVGSLGNAIGVAAASLLVLVPVTLLGFTVLARAHARRLSMLFLAANAMLLVPWRETGAVMMLAAGVALLLYLGQRVAQQENASIKTAEGVIALALQTLPMGILLGRGVWLYSAEPLLLSVMTLAVFMLVRQISVLMPVTSAYRHFLDGFSLLPSLTVVPLLAESFYVGGSFWEPAILPLCGLVGASMLYDVSNRSPVMATVGRALAVALLAVCLLLNISALPGAMSAAVSIVVGGLLVSIGYYRRQLILLTSGSVFAALGSAYQMHALLDNFELSGWVATAVLGMLAIVLGSVIESGRLRASHRFAALKQAFREWEK